MSAHHPEIESIEGFRAHLAAHGSLSGVVLQGLDLTGETHLLASADVDDTLFLGCRLTPATLERLQSTSAVLFPTLDGFPYRPCRGTLYSPEELLGDYRPGRPETLADTLDDRIYQHYIRTGRANPPSIRETLARRLHDHAMTDALEETTAGRTVVAIMGGHSLCRDSGDYLNAARISRRLTREGMLMASGGGPGAMEAANLGAWFAERSDDELVAAMQQLSKAPLYTPKTDWLDAACAVREAYPLPERSREASRSIGIPTWLYGHEPPNAFATDIAKYFANSVREDGLLTVAMGGILFSPGSAGTIQEIFQDATQNHYKTLGVISPMVFLGVDYWTRIKPVYPLLVQLAEGHDYRFHLHITDDPDVAVRHVLDFRAACTLASQQEVDRDLRAR